MKGGLWYLESCETSKNKYLPRTSNDDHPNNFDQMFITSNEKSIKDHKQVMNHPKHVPFHIYNSSDNNFRNKQGAYNSQKGRKNIERMKSPMIEKNHKGSIRKNDVGVRNKKLDEALPRNKLKISSSPYTSKYQNKLFGYFLSCTKFRHRAQDLKTYDVIRYRGYYQVPELRHVEQIRSREYG